jgi:ribose 5-phosphate isomerase B
MEKGVKIVYLAGDHAGFKLKEKIKPFLKKKGYNFEDLGPYELNKKDNYPDFVIPLAKKVQKDPNSIGIILAGSGQGEAMASNKFNNIRAAVFYGKNKKIPLLAKEHNDANILSIGTFFVSEKEAKESILLFLKTKFKQGRHEERLNKFSKLGS